MRAKPFAIAVLILPLVMQSLSARAAEVALETIIAHWLNRNVIPSHPSGGCAHCGNAEGPDAGRGDGAAA